MHLKPITKKLLRIAKEHRGASQESRKRLAGTMRRARHSNHVKTNYGRLGKMLGLGA